MKGQRNPRSFVNSLTGQRQIDWTPKQLAFLMQDIPRADAKAYMSFIYLTGARLNEPLEHIKKLKIFEKIKDPNGKITREWTGEYETIKVLGFICGQIVRVERYIKEIDKIIPFIDFTNLYVSKTRIKNPLLSTRTVAVNAVIYKEILDNIFTYIRNERLERESKLFNFGERTAEKLVNKYLGTPVHYLRHLRATHLRTYHNYDSLDLKDFFRWKDSRQADTYAHLDPKKLAIKQI